MNLRPYGPHGVTVIHCSVIFETNYSKRATPKGRRYRVRVSTTHTHRREKRDDLSDAIGERHGTQINNHRLFLFVSSYIPYKHDYIYR